LHFFCLAIEPLILERSMAIVRHAILQREIDSQRGLWRRVRKGQ